MILICCLLNAVSGDYACHDDDSSSSSTEGHTAPRRGEKKVCCKAEHTNHSITVTHFGCDVGCCGERDDQYCCQKAAKKDSSSVIGGSVAGALVFVGAVVLLMCIFRKHCRNDYKCSDHKKLLNEAYTAKTLDELFVPAHPLVSAPGTIIHPTTNINGPMYTMDAPASAYVMPDLDRDQPQIVVQPPPPAQPAEHAVNDDDNEENWDTWDGFPDHVGVSALSGTNSAGRGRDNPYYQGEGGEGAEGEDGLPYYYEQYDKYAQPPPGYEEATQETPE